MSHFIARSRHFTRIALVYQRVIQKMELNTVGNVEKAIRKKLEESLQVTHLEIVNESYMHNVPKGSETHFRVYVVSPVFANLSLVKRHQAVYAALKEELESGVHALAIQAKTPEQWNCEQSDHIEKSPPCQGGFGK